MRDHVESILQATRDRSAHGRRLPAFVEKALRAYLARLSRVPRAILGPMAAIPRIHWYGLGPWRWGGEPGELFVQWPEPVRADVCMRNAGFEGFGGDHAEWSAELEAILATAAARLGRNGPVLVNGRSPTTGASRLERLLAALGRRPRPRATVAAQLLEAMDDDRFAPCVVTMGEPVRAALATGDGHFLAWTWLHREVAAGWPEHLAAVAGARETIQTRLRWAFVMPGWLQQAEDRP